MYIQNSAAVAVFLVFHIFVDQTRNESGSAQQIETNQVTTIPHQGYTPLKSTSKPQPFGKKNTSPTTQKKNNSFPSHPVHPIPLPRRPRRPRRLAPE